MASITNTNYTPQPAFKTIDLRLSFEEATFLRDILYKVGGNPTRSRRGFTEGIVLPLDEVLKTIHNAADLDGGVTFKNIRPKGKI